MAQRRGLFLTLHMHSLACWSVSKVILPPIFQSFPPPPPPIPPFPLEVPHLVSSSTDTFQVITPLVVSLRTGSLVLVTENFGSVQRKLVPPTPTTKFTKTCSSEPSCRLFGCHHSEGCHRYLLLWSDSYLVAPTFKAPAPTLIYSGQV